MSDTDDLPNVDLPRTTRLTCRPARTSIPTTTIPSHMHLCRSVLFPCVALPPSPHILTLFPPYPVQFVLFAISTGGSISFASYLLRTITGDAKEGEWINRGIAVAAVSGVCLIHAFAPRWGIWLSNGLGAFKLILLALLVCTGFAALAGNTSAPRPNPSNFSSFHGPEYPLESGRPLQAAAGYALALLQVLYSYSGWENANYVLTEVHNAPKTLRRAAPIAISVVTVLYVLANVAYFAAMDKTELRLTKVTVAATLFENVWGKSAFVTKALPFFISLSALGNVFAQSFAMPRVKQELAKEGVLPFSRFFASDWPFNAPSGAILLHWVFTSTVILASQGKDVYTFTTNVFTYSSNWIKVFLGIGLVYLNFTPSEKWAEQRTTFRSSPILTIFWIVSLLFVQGAPFIPTQDESSTAIPFFVVPTLGTSLLAIGTVYWLGWAKVLPAFGYDIQHEIVQMPDGSERVKYKVSLNSENGIKGESRELTGDFFFFNSGRNRKGERDKDNGNDRGDNRFGRVYIVKMSV